MLTCTKCGKEATIKDKVVRCDCKVSYIDQNGAVQSIPCKPDEIVVVEIPRVRITRVVSLPNEKEKKP